MHRASKKIILPDPSVRSVMIKYLEKTGEINFDKIFNQRLGYLLFKDFCLNVVLEQVSPYFYELQFTFYMRYCRSPNSNFMRKSKSLRKLTQTMIGGKKHEKFTIPS